MQINLARNGAPTLDLRSLHSTLHALPTISIPEAPFALGQHVHRLVARRVEAMAGDDAVLQHRERRVPPLLEPAARDVGGTAGLIEQLHAGDLREPGDFVEEVAAVQLDSGRGRGLAAEGGHEAWELGDAGVAVGGGEVAAALEDAGEGGASAAGAAGAGGGFVVFGFGGLLDEGGEEGREGLGVEAGGI